MAVPNYYFPYQTTPVMQVPQQVVPQQVAPQPTPQDNAIKWVQGESGAKAYPIAPNSSVLLMDSENPVMYIKSADNSGMPLPLRIFDYTERKGEEIKVAPIEGDKFVSREEFDKLREDVIRLSKGIRKPNVSKDKEE